MLVLARKNRESVVIGGADSLHELLRVTVIEIRGTSVRLGFDASADVPVHRAEVWERIQAENSTPGSNNVFERQKHQPPYCDLATTGKGNISERGANSPQTVEQEKKDRL